MLSAMRKHEWTLKPQTWRWCWCCAFMMGIGRGRLFGDYFSLILPAPWPSKMHPAAPARNWLKSKLQPDSPMLITGMWLPSLSALEIADCSGQWLPSMNTSRNFHQHARRTRRQACSGDEAELEFAGSFLPSSWAPQTPRARCGQRKTMGASTGLIDTFSWFRQSRLGRR
jgi:hypothetical protein